MPGPISETTSAPRVACRPIDLAAAANRMRLVKITNRSNDLAPCALPHVPDQAFRDGVDEAMGACAKVIREELQDARDKDKVRLEKAMGWLEGQGAQRPGVKVLNAMTVLGATHAALRHLCAATPAEAVHMEWVSKIQGAIVSAARAIGACEASPSGDYLGNAESEKVNDALKEAGDRLVECVKVVGGHALTEAIVAGVLPEAMYLAIKTRHGEARASQFVEGGDCAGRVDEVLNKDELDRVQNSVESQLRLENFAGVQGAILEALKLPALVVNPQPGKQAPKAPAQKEHPLPTIPPQMRELAKSGGGINIAQNVNNFDEFANALGSNADLVKAIVNAVKEGIAIGERTGSLGARLERIENRCKKLQSRNEDLERQNQALQDQLLGQPLFDSGYASSTRGARSSDAQSTIYDNLDHRQRNNEPAVGQSNTINAEDAAHPVCLDQRAAEEIRPDADDGVEHRLGEVGRNEMPNSARPMRMINGGTFTSVDDSAFVDLRNTLDDIEAGASRGGMNHDPLENAADLAMDTSSHVLDRLNESVVTLSDAPNQGVAAGIPNVSDLIASFQQLIDSAASTSRNHSPRRLDGESPNSNVSLTQGSGGAGAGQVVEEYTTYINKLNEVQSPHVAQRMVIKEFTTNQDGKLQAAYEAPWHLKDRMVRTVAPSDVLGALNREKKSHVPLEEKHEAHELLVLNERYNNLGELKDAKSLLKLTKEVAKEFRQREGAMQRPLLISSDRLQSKKIRESMFDRLMAEDLNGPAVPAPKQQSEMYGSPGAPMPVRTAVNRDPGDLEIASGVPDKASFISEREQESMKVHHSAWRPYSLSFVMQ